MSSELLLVILILQSSPKAYSDKHLSLLIYDTLTVLVPRVTMKFYKTPYYFFHSKISWIAILLAKLRMFYGFYRMMLGVSYLGEDWFYWILWWWWWWPCLGVWETGTTSIVYSLIFVENPDWLYVFSEIIVLG